MVKDCVVSCISTLLVIPESDIKDEVELEAGLGMDSLDIVELVMLLDEEFDIDLADEELGQCKTVADVVALVQGKVPA